jgi:hypothetical protein
MEIYFVFFNKKEEGNPTRFGAHLQTHTACPGLSGS